MKLIGAVWSAGQVNGGRPTCVCFYLFLCDHLWIWNGLKCFGVFFFVCRFWPPSHRRLDTAPFPRRGGVMGVQVVPPLRRRRELMTTFNFPPESGLARQTWDVWWKRLWNGGFQKVIAVERSIFKFGDNFIMKVTAEESGCVSSSILLLAALVAANNKQQRSINKKTVEKGPQITLKCVDFMNLRNKVAVNKKGGFV